MMKKEVCPTFEAGMSIISQRWVGLIIYQLMDAPQRFSSLEQSVGISARVLSDRLKSLEQADIVKREVFPVTPVLIEYSLTEKGKALKPVLDSLYTWSESWLNKD